MKWLLIPLVLFYPNTPNETINIGATHLSLFSSKELCLEAIKTNFDFENAVCIEAHGWKRTTPPTPEYEPY